MSNVGVPNTQSSKYYFFSSDTSVACWPLSDSFLYFMEFVLGLIVPWFLPFVWYKFLYGWLSIWKAFFAALSAFSFPWMPMWLGIQENMILLFLERVFSLFRNFVIKGDDVSLFCSASRTDLESVYMINLEVLWFAMIFIARSMAVVSAL